MRHSAPQFTHLQMLEAEAIYMIREVAAETERPVLLFSGGKDSIVTSHLARKAFYPGTIPFPLMHIDTGHNFPETLEYRDQWGREMGTELIVRSVEDSIRAGRAFEKPSDGGSRNHLQSITLLDALREFRFDVAIGGARRDEEKARAKERFFSFRDELGQWDPKNQRPELWSLYNSLKNPGEHFRVFPISNWTEMDVWLYLRKESIQIPNLYFTHQRTIVERDGVLLAECEFNRALAGEELHTSRVRFRTIGDVTCTGAVASEAANIEEIIQDIAATRTSERGGRADDRRSAAAMEDRKREGYF